MTPYNRKQMLTKEEVDDLRKRWKDILYTKDFSEISTQKKVIAFCGNFSDIIDTALALYKVKDASEKVDRCIWFDPIENDAACIVCDANMHPNCKGVHAQIDGSVCSASDLHEALDALREV